MPGPETVERAPAGPKGRSRALVLVALGAILLLAIGVRAWALERPGRILSRDGIRYAKIARALGEGRPGDALANDYAPGFPAAAAIAGRARGAATDRDFADAGAWASVLAGALSVVPVFLLGRRAAGPRAGLLGALALALHPHHVDASADALSEPLMLLFALGALAAGFAAAERMRPGPAAGSPYELGEPGSGRPPPPPELGVDAPDSGPSPPPPGRRAPLLLAALGGLLGAASYLARPEGILVALGPLALGAGRARRAAATVAALALLAAPYVALASADTGRLAITKKKDAAALLSSAVERPGEVASNALRNLGRAVESGQAAAVLAALGLLLGAARGGPGRRLALACGAAILLLLGAESVVRVDPRFGLALSVLAAPLAGVALEALLVLVERRRGAAEAAGPPHDATLDGFAPHDEGSPGSPPQGGRDTQAGVVTALILALASAPGIVRASAPDRPHYLDCARAIEAVAASCGGAPPAILAPDPRIAHLAGDEGASDARGRPRLEPADAARAGVLVRYAGEPPPPGVRLRPIGRFDPPAGSRARGLLADLVERE